MRSHFYIIEDAKSHILLKSKYHEVILVNLPIL